MIVSAPTDYRAAARARLPRFLFDYIDGGAGAETTLARNSADLQTVTLPQRVLRDMSALDCSVELFGERWDLPLALAPVGITGMYARRGETQAARAARQRGIPYTLSTVSVCPLPEVVQASASTPVPASGAAPGVWFQLYVLKDRGFMRDALERALAAGLRTLVFTVDMPVPGARYRDARSGMSGPWAASRRILQAVAHPRWALDVGVLGRPHDLGNISAYLGKPTALADYMGWIGANFDPSISWADLEWIRQFWPGPMLIKGLLDPGDARDAVRFGADGIVVSNHGGRQLDGAASTASVLPAIADAVGSDLVVLADSGVRSGLDLARMLSLGARGVLIGRSYIYALAARGQAGVEHVLDLYAAELKVAMTLTGAKTVADLAR